MATREQPRTPVTVDYIKEHELYGVLLQARGEAAPLSDEVIREELFAAEDFYERELQLRWSETRVFSDVFGRQQGVFPPNIAALPGDYDELNDLDEPAYDYSRDLWEEGRWAFIDLNYRPVRDVTLMLFAFPGVDPIFDVPKKWLRLDRKFGRLQLVPSDSSAVLATFSAYIMHVIAGGRGLPQSIYVDYTVGFAPDELSLRHRDLLKGLRLRTILGLMGQIVSIAAPGGLTGASLGLDGLSRSQSWGGKFGPYAGRIELALQQEQEIRDTWKRREHGVPVVFA